MTGSGVTRLFIVVQSTRMTTQHSRAGGGACPNASSPIHVRRRRCGRQARDSRETRQASPEGSGGIFLKRAREIQSVSLSRNGFPGAEKLRNNDDGYFKKFTARARIWKSF